MPKPIVQIRNARIVPYSSIHVHWPVIGDMVLVGILASKHPVLGEPVGLADIRTSLIVEQRLSKREVETLNTIYQLVD